MHSLHSGVVSSVVWPRVAVRSRGRRSREIILKFTSRLDYCSTSNISFYSVIVQCDLLI